MSIILFILLSFTRPSYAQVIFSGSYAQNFNSFSGGSAPAGWSYTGTFRGSGTGTSNTGGAWAYGSGSDWSMGLLHSGTAGIINITGSFTNSSGATITALTISYNFEQWRYANGSGLVASSAGALAGSSSAINSALSGSGTSSGSSGSVTTTPKTVSLTGLSIAPGAAFSITWTVDDPGGSDNGISVDDFVMCIPNGSFPVTAANTSPVGTGVSFSLSSTPTGTATPFTYSWTGPTGSAFSSTNQNPVIPAASVTSSYDGTYTVVVTDANNCTSRATTTATVTAVACTGAPTAVTATASSTSLCSGTSLTLTGAATDAASYSWSGPGGYTAAVLNPAAIITSTLSAGVYTLVATNSCGSTTVTTSAVAINTVPTAVTATPSSTVLCSGASLTLAGAATGGTSYSWSGPGSYSAAALNPPAVTTTTLSAGIYTLTATNACGNTTVTTSPVTINTSPTTVTAALSSTSLCSGATLTLTGTAAGATTYLWSGPDGYSAGVLTPTGVATSALSAGVYSFTATNSCGSTSATTALLTILTLPTAVTAAASATTLCSGDALTLTGSAAGATSYSWAGPNGYSAVVLNPPAITTSSLSAGIYTLTAVNVCGNTTANTASVIINTVPTTVTATASATILCSGNTLTLTGSASGATSYSWAGPDGYTAAVLNPVGIITNTLSGGVYTLTAINVCGNTTAATFSVTINNVPVAVTATAVATTVCSGDVLTISGTATSATSYSWSGPGGYSSTDLNPAGITTSTLSAGIYTLTASNTCGNTTAATATVIISVVPYSVSATASATTLCAGDALILSGTATDATAYSWAGPDGYTAVVLNPAAITTATLSAGVYTLTASNGCGSANASTAAVTVNDVPLAIVATAAPAVLCSGDLLTLTGAATNAVSYSWAGPDGFTSTDLNPPSIATSTLSAGVYTLTATNSCGNTIATTAAVTVNTVPALVTAMAAPAVVCTGNTLSITGTATGATSYSWAGPDGYSSVSLSPGGFTTSTLSAGVYTLTATNVCGSTSATTASVTILTVPTGVTATASDLFLCGGQSLTLTGTSTGASTYNWSGPGGYFSGSLNPASITVSSSSTGVYTLTATNVCGSITATTAPVTIVILPTSVTASVVASSLCVGAAMIISGAATGAASYSWSGPSGFTSTNLNPGTYIAGTASSGVYTLSAINACGTVTATAAITIDVLPAVAAITGASSVCEASTISLANSIPGGVWSSNNMAVATVNTLGAVTGMAAGAAIISYAVTNVCGTALATKEVTVVSIPVSTPILGSSVICLGSPAVFTSAISGGAWSSSNGLVATIDGTGVVTAYATGEVIIAYTVSNSCGTTITDTATVTVDDVPNAGTIYGPVRVCPADTIRLNNLTPGGAWYVVNSHAVIAASGLVTGVSNGVDTAMYVVANTCGTDTTRFPFYVRTNDECMIIAGVGNVNTPTLSCVIYPNPTNGVFTISGILYNDDNEADIDIVSAVGQVVYRNTFAARNGKIEDQIQLNADLATGIYILKMSSRSGMATIRFSLER